MVHERFDGQLRELTWGELQDLSNQAANLLEAHDVERGDRVAVVLPPTPETAATFFGTWKLGAILLSMSILYGDEGIRHRVTDSQAKVAVTDAANVDRIDRNLVEHVIVLDDKLLADASTNATTSGTVNSSSASASGPGRPGSHPCSVPGGSARRSSSFSARAASTPSSSSRCCRGEASRTSSIRQRR